uniref:Uncharacterized protein n=1 Tax=Hyaloperonospora arabidopsidis (strain Emoy2) TaxID=559515 RepID=M4BG72_HYAAE
MFFCVWVINGITENDSKALFMYNCVLEDLERRGISEVTLWLGHYCDART